MNEIFDAEVFVETQFSIDSSQNNGNWFRLADYATMDEFLIDCAGWFDDEEEPEYVYLEWQCIPDTLINRHWFCPAFFEIRDALQMIEPHQVKAFVSWCANNGHDLINDEPTLLVTRYQDTITPEYDSDTEITECNDEGNPYPGFFYGLTGHYGKPVEIFDDNYN